MREGLLDTNPAANTNRFPTKPRKHVLADEEIRAIWQATADDSAYSAIVRLLFLLGCRRQELGGLRWDEIDSDNALITLPPERTKGGRAFVIPLPSPAREILESRPRGVGEFVFGPQGADGFNSWSRGKADLDARSGVSGWRLHDIRRVVSTRLHEDLLQPPHLIEAILGHHQPGVASVYNRSSYIAERRRVLAQWADYLFSIIEDRLPTVVPFAKASQ
jgi:integrase